MMQTTRLDTIGLYEWDNTIFDNMVIPDGLNKDDLINMIMLDTRELSVSIMSPTIMKKAIELWSKKWIYYWTELLKTTELDYNILENYDRYENSTHKGKSSNTGTQTGNRTMTQGGKNVTTDDLSVAAYNSSTKTPRETHSITNEPDLTSTETPNLTNKDDGSSEMTIDSHIHGNIGVASSMDLIKQQRSVIEISVYQVIIESYKREFLILKY